MLTILITPTALIFNDLPDTIFKDLVENFGLNLTTAKKGYKLEGSKEKLFTTLHKLSYKYDIELM